MIKILGPIHIVNDLRRHCDYFLLLFSSGEYVILVEDVTNPEFMDLALAPAFLQVNVVIPKKQKQIKKKDKGPRSVDWYCKNNKIKCKTEDIFFKYFIVIV